MLDVGWLDGCWMVGESGIKANSAQFSWSLAELGKKKEVQQILWIRKFSPKILDDKKIVRKSFGPVGPSH